MVSAQPGLMAGMVEAAKHLHGKDYRGVIASGPSSQRHAPGARSAGSVSAPKALRCKRLDPVADRREHALDLVVLAFGQRQAQRALGDGLAGRGTHRPGLVVQQHAFEQPRDLRRVDRVLAADLVDLGDVALRRGQPVDQRAVVAQQQQAGGVGVEPADRLHVAPAQRRRQQAVDAGVVRGLLRALDARPACSS